MKYCFVFVLVFLVLLPYSNHAQQLNFSAKGKNKKETFIIDSLGYNTTHKNYKSITTEINTLKNKLLQLGYVALKLGALKKTNDSSFVAKFTLNTQIKILKVYYKANIVTPSQLKGISNKVTSTYFILPIYNVASALNTLNYSISNLGDPFSKLQLKNIGRETNNILRADLTISTTSKIRRINTIKVEGYDKFPKAYLKHFLKLKTGKIFNLETIKNKTEQLNNLRFANQVKPPEVLFKKDSTTLYVYIEKAKSNTFDGFLGFGTNEDTNSIEFDGFLNLKLINNLNYGETFSLLYKSDENDQETFDVYTELPYLFGSPVGVDLNLRLFRRDSSFSTVDQKAKLNYQINALHKVSSGITTTQSTNLRDDNTVTAFQDYTANFFSLAYTFTKPKFYDFLFPIKAKFNLETNFGNRKTNTNTIKQTLLHLNTFYNFTLNAKNSLYLNVDAANLISDNFFENELQRFGGINSIRGFEENSLLASLFGVLNTEYRYRVSNSIYIHSITDLAYFENGLLDSKEKLISYGFGFGIVTKSGLLKFNYANGKNENQRFRFSNSKIHLSLIATF